MNAKVSVIIPTYKRSEFLERAIESVLHQTHDNIEIVVVDDNDPDSHYRRDTVKKMGKYNQNNKIKYIENHKNLGGALARNEGISQATGEFITFLDDDDIYLPEKVLIQIKYMLENKVDMSFTDVRIHNMDDVLVDYREHSYVDCLSNQELLKQHIMHHLTPTATYMYKKEAIVNIGGFDNFEVGQEFRLMLKTIESDLRIGYIPVSYVIQYIHDGERISIGQNKIDKEKEQFEFKKQYFKYLTLRQRQYVRFRYHAVMMFVGKRSGRVLMLLEHLIKAIVVSPVDSMKEFIHHIRKIRKHAIKI